MAWKWVEFICLVQTTAVITNVLAAGSNYYTAAVVELQPISGLKPQQNLEDMQSSYGYYIRSASAQGVDIIVFPEAGLFGSDYLIFHVIPDPRLEIVTAGNASYDQLVQQLSTYAKEYSIYVAVNLLENYTDASNTTKKFNANVVFDRTGAVVARYRKYNLYGEPVSRTEQFEPSYFDSDFGVRFGQIVGLDILYKEPLQILMKEFNVKDFIYSSEWFSALPFLTAPQVQWMFSVGNDVNLLASGLNRVDRGSTGSGIYRGKNAPTGGLFIFSDESQRGMLVANVSTDGQKAGFQTVGDTLSRTVSGPTPLPLLRQKELDEMTNANIELSPGNTTSNFVQRLCHRSLCCTFDITMSRDYSSNSSVQYKAVAFDGNRTSTANKTKLVQGLQLCGVVMCSNGSISSCGPPAVNWTLPNLQTPSPGVIFNSVVVSGNFTNNESSVSPDVLLWPTPGIPVESDTRGEFLIDPRMVNFTNVDGDARLSFEQDKKIISVGLFSRVFSRDVRFNANSVNKMAKAQLLPIISLALYLSYYPF